jgi:hypothetical protein
MVSVS